jgi:hypothetical protein
MDLSDSASILSSNENCTGSLLSMIVVKTSHSHVMKILLHHCELSIFVTVSVIFLVKSAMMRTLFLSKFCNHLNSCV